MSQVSHHETWQHHSVRKKVKALSVKALSTAPHIVLFRPAPGRQFLPEKFITKVRSTGPANASVAGSVAFDNGTDAQTHAAALAVGVAEGDVVHHPIVTARVVDYDHPLRMRVTAAGTASEYLVDVTVFLHKLSD